MKGRKSAAISYGPKNDEKRKTHIDLIPYAELPEDLKEANRLNVRDIPGKLAVAGYIMIPARSNEPPFNFPGKPLEQLAEAEHKRWMQSKLNDGWKVGPRTDSNRKIAQMPGPLEEVAGR